MKVHILLKILRKKRIEKGLIKLLLSPPALVVDLHQNACYSVRAYRASNVNNMMMELYLPSGSFS